MQTGLDTGFSRYPGEWVAIGGASAKPWCSRVSIHAAASRKPCYS